MGQGYLVDSNVIIDYRANRIPLESLGFIRTIFREQFRISVVVKIEVLGHASPLQERAMMRAFIDKAELIPLDTSTIECTIDLRCVHRKLKLGDAIIAATALERDLTLITHNIADFKNIVGLTILDPYTMNIHTLS